MRPPDLSRQEHADETTCLVGAQDIFPVMTAPFDAPVRCASDFPATSDKELRHLFLICVEQVLAALEFGPSGKATQRGRLAHTNLSGSREAHAGGEVWWRDSTSIWITGGSGRFPPRSPDELSDIGLAFATAGYAVCSCGWDVELNAPARLFRGLETWI